MAILLHQCAAALYLLAGIVAWLGMAWRAPRLERGAVGVLLAGALVHVVAFGALHRLDPVPPLTDLPAALSFTAGVGTFFFLAMMRRLRLAGLTVLVAPASFCAVFLTALNLPDTGTASIDGTGSWPHAHVVLSSIGLALLGLSGLAGLFFLAEHRRLKSKRRIDLRIPLPSLEALDRVNRLSLAVGFPLLTLGVLTGMMWVNAVHGNFWTGARHELWSVTAWAVYAVLVVARFGASQGARQAALSAVGAFAFLLFAVVGVELLA
jgi:ABC-type transport system involved in cytochrome c biogenesis permease subunit